MFACNVLNSLKAATAGLLLLGVHANNMYYIGNGKYTVPWIFNYSGKVRIKYTTNFDKMMKKKKQVEKQM